VPWPMKGPLPPGRLGGGLFGGAVGVEVVAGGGDGRGSGGVGVGVRRVVAGGVATWAIGVALGVEEEEEGGEKHFGELCRLEVTLKEFEGAEATRATTARAETARRWRA